MKTDPFAPQWLIWSREHQAWWRHASAGYTLDPDSAGRYTLQQATRICANANRFSDLIMEEIVHQGAAHLFKP